MNTDFKSDILRNIECYLMNHSHKDKEKIMSTLVIAFRDYKFIPKKYEIVEYVAEKNKRIIQKFFICKRIEGLSDKTLNYYSTILKYFMRIIDKDLTTVTTDDIRYYLALLMKDGKNNNTSVDNNRRVLNSFFSWVLEEEMIEKNPVLKIKKIKTPKLVKEPFSILDIEKMRNVCETPLEKALFEVLISSGARRTEIATALKKDYSSSSGEILVIGKGKKQRKLFLSTKAILELDKYLATRTDDSSYLFTQNRSCKNPVSTTFLANTIKKIGEKADVKDVHLHRFRRTMATLALKKGIPIEQVQKILGHTQLETTLIYAKIDQENLKNNFKKFMF